MLTRFFRFVTIFFHKIVIFFSRDIIAYVVALNLQALTFKPAKVDIRIGTLYARGGDKKLPAQRH